MVNIFIMKTQFYASCILYLAPPRVQMNDVDSRWTPPGVHYNSRWTPPGVQVECIKVDLEHLKRLRAFKKIIESM